MGMFNFLKKSKSDTISGSMELPPMPKLDSFGDMDTFPEMPSQDIPPLPESMLPPLPNEMPSPIPPAPQPQQMAPPRVELPPVPEAPQYAPRMLEPNMQQNAPEPAPQQPLTAARMEAMIASRPEFPTIPTTPSEDVVPDRIPPLEGLPEPPRFVATEEPETHAEPIPLNRLDAPAMPDTYFTPEVKQEPRRRSLVGPFYLRTDQFRSIAEHIELVRSKFSEEDDLFFRVTEVKNAQDQKYEAFRQSLEDMQRKLLFIDKSLFETSR